MPQAWTEKRERQYEHIKHSMEDRGASESRAEEVAARTVNKQRRVDGETPNSRTQGTGNPNTPLDERTREELYNRAKALDIECRSEMTKFQLVDAIRERNN